MKQMLPIYTPEPSPNYFPNSDVTTTFALSTNTRRLLTTPKRRPPRRELEDGALEVAREDRARAEERLVRVERRLDVDINIIRRPQRLP